MAQKLFALLVGINEYHAQSRVSSLRGCVNDVDGMENVLKHKYKSLCPSICKLTNEQATWQNIVGTFRSHLRDNATPNTTVLFYFSGHGSRQSTDEAFFKYLPAADYTHLKDETLVCYDSRVVVNNRMIGRDLADKELAVLIDEVSSKGAQVVVIFDCCHAGSATRKIKEREAYPIKNDILVREVKNRVTAAGEVRHYLNGHYQKNQLTQVPEGKHVLLAACQKNQTAKECTIKGKKRGVFSYHLQEVLNQYPELSYVQAFAQARTKVMQYKLKTPQTPQMEVYGFFNTQAGFARNNYTTEDKQRYKVYYKGSGWFIDAGSVTSLPRISQKPIQALIYQVVDSTQEIAHAKVLSVGLYQSHMRLLQGQLDQNKTYWAEILTPLEARLPIQVKGDPVLINRLQKKYNDVPPMYFRLSTLEETHPFSVSLKENTCDFMEQGISKHQEPFHPVIAKLKLDRMARWYLLLNNNNSNTHLQPEDFGFTLQKRDGQVITKATQYFQNTQLLCSPDYSKSPEKIWSTPYQVVACNCTQQDLYFTLLYFSPHYGIEVYYNQPVPAQSKEFILTNKYSLTLRQKEQVTDSFQLLVSTHKIPDHYLNQLDIKNSPRDSEEDEQLSIAEDWCTVTIKLNLQKEDVSM